MSHRATGTFEVQLSPQEDAGSPVGRMSIDKQVKGALEATSKGQMLMAASESVQGSAGYVAIEKVTGTLDGRTGTFCLQHNATMNRGAGDLNIIVIPDTGTEELTGLSGTMNIIVDAGKHSYEFDYELP